jgi:hypothetical protein
MRWTLALTVAMAVLLLTVPAPAEGQVNRDCKSVTSVQWKATRVTALNMTCRSARNKLRRWLRRERLPHNVNGCDCKRIAVHGRNRQCGTSLRRGNVGLVWRQRKQ